jgi:hypothetical protein
MSQENVEAFKWAIEAYNRRDIDAFLEEIDPEVEWQGRFRHCSRVRRRCTGDTRGQPNDFFLYRAASTVPRAPKGVHPTRHA